MQSVTGLSTVNTGDAGHVLFPSTTRNDSTTIWGTFMVSDRQREMYTLVNLVCLCGVIGLFGIISNVINMISFYEQGLDTTINISFFSLALSDLCSLIFQTWYTVCSVPYFQQLGLPMVYLDVQYVIGGIPRESFARITCLITAYITAERCMCIAFPLQVKQMITPRRTTVIIIVIFLVVILYGIPLYVVGYLDWQYYPHLNKTLLGAVVAAENKNIAEGLSYIIHSFLSVASLIAVVVFTSILIRKLGQTSAWRQSVQGNQENADPTSKRDRATMRMVVLIAVILIVSYVPVTALGVTTFCEPEFVNGGKYFNLYYILWSFALLFETINSSVNIFFYYRMSTKFRRVFKERFLVCGRPVNET